MGNKTAEAGQRICPRGEHSYAYFDRRAHCVACGAELRYSCRDQSNCQKGHSSPSTAACRADPCPRSPHNWQRDGGRDRCSACSSLFGDLFPRCYEEGKEELVKGKSDKSPCPRCGLYDPFAGLY